MSGSSCRNTNNRSCCSIKSSFWQGGRGSSSRVIVVIEAEIEVAEEAPLTAGFGNAEGLGAGVACGVERSKVKW